MAYFGPKGAAAVLRLGIDGEDLCGECSLNVQLSGQCHVEECANKVLIDQTVQIIKDYIESPALQPYVLPGGSINVIQINRFCKFTSLLFFECIQYVHVY